MGRVEDARRTRGDLLTHHETHQPYQNRLNTPSDVPTARVEVTHACAEGLVREETTGGGEHAEFGRGEGVILRVREDG